MQGKMRKAVDPFLGLANLSEPPAFGSLRFVRLEVSGPRLKAWVEGRSAKAAWEGSNPRYEGAGSAALKVRLLEKEGGGEAVLEFGREGALPLYEEGMPPHGTSYGAWTKDLTGSPPPLLPSLERLAQLLEELSRLFGEEFSGRFLSRARERLLTLASFLEERGEDQGFFSHGPFKLVRRERGAVLWNAELHPLAPVLEKALRGEIYEGPFPGYPDLLLRVAPRKGGKNPRSLYLKPIFLQVGPLTLHPTPGTKVEAFSSPYLAGYPQRNLLRAFGLERDEVALLKSEGPEALAKALALRRVAEL